MIFWFFCYTHIWFENLDLLSLEGFTIRYDDNSEVAYFLFGHPVYHVVITVNWRTEVEHISERKLHSAFRLCVSTVAFSLPQIPVVHFRSSRIFRALFGRSIATTLRFLLQKIVSYSYMNSCSSPVCISTYGTNRKVFWSETGKCLGRPHSICLARHVVTSASSPTICGKRLNNRHFGQHKSFLITSTTFTHQRERPVVKNKYINYLHTKS